MIPKIHMLWCEYDNTSVWYRIRILYLLTAESIKLMSSPNFQSHIVIFGFFFVEQTK